MWSPFLSKSSLNIETHWFELGRVFAVKKIVGKIADLVLKRGKDRFESLSILNTTFCLPT